MKHVLLFDRALMVRMRIKEALGNGYKVYEVESETDVYNNVLKHLHSLELVIMDVASDSDDNFAILKRIKELSPSLPVIILTSSNKRTDFIKGIQSGAADYILKPFDDTHIKSRIDHIFEQGASGGGETEALIAKMKQKPLAQGQTLPINSEEDSSKLEDFIEELRAEKYKAKKGKYPLTVFALTFEAQVNTNGTFDERHYEDIRAQLWESDTLFKKSSNGFYGLLPFCPENGFHRFKEKLEHFLNEEADEKNFYQMYRWNVAGITLADEGHKDMEPGRIIELLELAVKQNAISH